MRNIPEAETSSEPRDPYTIAELGLLSTQESDTFDAVTRMATRLFDVPVALISVIDEEQDRQFFASHKGLTDPWASQRQTPLSHSFCQHVKRTGAPLVVADATAHPLVCDNPAITDLSVAAYLGVPFHSVDGTALGALCVIDTKPHDWTGKDIETLEDLARCVNDEIRLRTALRTNEIILEKTRRYTAMRESITLAFMAPDLTVDQRFQGLLRAGCDALNVETGVISKIDGGVAEILFAHGSAPQCCGSSPAPHAHSLSELVTAGQQQVCFQDVAASGARGRHSMLGTVPRGYAAAPLIFDGVLFGTLEFTSSTPCSKPWPEEEMSMISIIAMFACAYLGMFGQIRMLKGSETDLIHSLIDGQPEPDIPLPRA